MNILVVNDCLDNGDHTTARTSAEIKEDVSEEAEALMKSFKCDPQRQQCDPQRQQCDPQRQQCDPQRQQCEPHGL